MSVLCGKLAPSTRVNAKSEVVECSVVVAGCCERISVLVRERKVRGPRAARTSDRRLELANDAPSFLQG